MELKMHARFLSGKLNRRDHSEDKGLGTMVVPCKQGNAFLGSVEFCDPLSD
jgi:hypothetical protein